MGSAHTAERDIVTTVVDHVLTPEELLTLLAVGRPVDAQLTTSPTGTHERKLGGRLTTILLSKIRALEGGVEVRWW